jgi:hypothetical protein
MSTQPVPPPSTGAHSTPEAQAALFASDSRIHYSRESGTWRLENEDGSELEYDVAKGTWVALVGTGYKFDTLTCRPILMDPGGRGTFEKATGGLFSSRGR